jgi:hypothetical protein
MIGDGESCLRDDAQKALNWSLPTMRRWLDQSKRFMRAIDPRNGRALVVRRPKDDGATSDLSGEGPSSRQTANDAATSGLSDSAANKGEGAQGELPIA